MPRLRLAAFLLVTFALPLSAQTSAPPDLTGTRALDVSKSKLAKHLTAQSETLVITCSGSSIVMRDTIDGKVEVHTYVVDGKEHPYAEVQGGDDLTKVYWKKSTLVIENFARLKMPNTPMDGSTLWSIKDRWTLSADGRTLTDESERSDSKTVSVYDKQ